MNRIAVSVLMGLTLSFSFMSCATAPSSNAEVGLVRFGAGSVDDDPSSANKAAAPGMMQKVKIEELLAQARIHEQNLDDKLTAWDIPGALGELDAIVDLVGRVKAAAPRIQENRDKILAALDSLVIEAVGAPVDTIAGTAFKKDFSVRVSAQTADSKKPISSYEFNVIYPGSTAANPTAASTASAGASAKSGPDGVAAFTAPAPAKAGKGHLVFASALSTRDPDLASAIAKRNETGKLSLSFPHIAVTGARKMPTTIAILDYNKDGKPIGSSSTTATSLLMPLVKRGFNRIGMADFPSQLAAGDEAALIKAAKAQFGSGVQRFIFGTTRVIASSQGADGLWTATLEAKVSVWDFTEDRAVYTTTLTQTESAKTEAAAIDSARKKLASETLFEDLYYNM
ncbi:MAG TPA: hypothetical protein PKO22_05160 [Treponemataceae bacterium]|nr:hypothetical protein [Treponemataceae bacterium]